MEKPIAYEPHPVSAERKAELVAQGFRIMDAAFAPAGAVKAAPKVEEPVEAVAEVEIEDADVKPYRGRNKKA